MDEVEIRLVDWACVESESPGSQSHSSYIELKFNFNNIRIMVYLKIELK